MIEALKQTAPAASLATLTRQAPSAAAPAMASHQMEPDGYRATDVRVITYNTAIGNSKIKTRQADFLDLPFYRATLEGRPGAAILALQEVGNAQRDAVKRLAKGGQFTVLSQRVGLWGRQNNMIVIPKRYQVLSAENHLFGVGHLKGVARTLWGWVKRGFRGDLNLGQLTEPRGYQQLRLRDTLTGRTLTVFNSHLGYHREMKVEHGAQLFKAARAAEAAGPVIVAGDLNTFTADNDDGKDRTHAESRRNFVGYADMGPKGKPADKHNIDWVLAKGFEGVSSRWYLGNDIALPGSPDAAKVSDHYAEEDVLRFADR